MPADPVFYFNTIFTEQLIMHYRNGREAKNGDKVIQLGTFYDAAGNPINGVITAVGVLYDAKPGNDHCNGSIASTIGGPVVGACLCDCLHVEDLAQNISDGGLETRPEGM